MSLSYLDSTPSKILASYTSIVGRLAVLAAGLPVGEGFIGRIGKLNNMQRRQKLPRPREGVSLSLHVIDVFRTRCLEKSAAVALWVLMM